MTSKNEFAQSRRQKFLDEQYFNAYLDFYTQDVEDDEAAYSAPGQTEENRVRLMELVANRRLNLWRLKYTAGFPLRTLATEFEAVVNAYAVGAKHDRAMRGDSAFPYFDFKYMDDYVDVLALISVSILLHRTDLLRVVHSLFMDGSPDRADALVEDLLGKFLPNRPVLVDGFHELPFGYLLDATAETPPAEKQSDVQEFLDAWYPNMKGTGWFDSHKKQTAKGGGGYPGYWSFEAAAVAYLHGIDDAPFRNHLLYPKDLADFARSTPLPKMPEATVGQATTRCEGGQPCPRAGWWHTPASEGRRQRFEAGTIMPKYASDYGITIWQWDSNQAD